MDNEQGCRSLALLIAGALISAVAGGLLAVQQGDGWWTYLLIGMGLSGLLLLPVGFGHISFLRLRDRLAQRISPTIGILNDMGWDPNHADKCSATDVSPEEWKNVIDKRGRAAKARLRTKFIDQNENFGRFVAVLNPYGGVYPEQSLSTAETLNRILRFVKNGGLFVNVADIPGYYAYDLLTKSRVDTIPGIYRPTGERVRFYDDVPLLAALHLGVYNASPQGSPVTWEVVFAPGFRSLDIGIADLLYVDRAAVVAANAEAVLVAQKLIGPEDERLLTPMALVRYGKGRFLFSLAFLDSHRYPTNNRVCDILTKVLIHLTSNRA